MGIFVVEVADCPAIRYYDFFISPFITQNLHKQAVTSAAGFTFKAVVGTHHFFYVRFLNQVFKSGQISFP